MTANANATIRIVRVFNRDGVWMVEDPVSRVREALCCGAAELLDGISERTAHQEGGYIVALSDTAFPAATVTPTRMKVDDDGGWYYAERFRRVGVGFLCDETLKHFGSAPEFIYLRVDSVPVAGRGWN